MGSGAPRHHIRTRRAAAAAAALSIGLLSAVTLVLAAAPATAATSVQQAAVALSSSPVYVEPGNEAGVTSADAQRLLDEVQSAGTPLYVAVVKADSLGGQTIAQYTHAIGAAVGVQGTYAVVAGRSFYADSQVFPVAALATTSVAEHKGGGANAILDAFITGVGDLAAAQDGGSDGTGPGTGALDPGNADSGSSFSPWPLVAVAVVAVGAVALFGTAVSRSSRRRAAEQLASVRTVVDEDVTEFGEQVTAVDVNDARLDDAGRADLATALSAYDGAKAAAEAMRVPQDAAGVTSALDDGRFALACVSARIAGAPLPERRPPCFMDPRHGPSVQDVMWTPDGGAARSIPVCQACAVTLAEGGQPAARQVPVGTAGQRAPYWMAGPQYGAYAGGYYSSYGDMLPALMIGTMLAPHTTVIAGSGVDQGSGWFGGGGGGGGGDFGGGGWMGGGGGDFGGGGGDGGGGGGF